MNPLVLRDDGPVAVNLRIRVEPAPVIDPWLRALPV